MKVQCIIIDDEPLAIKLIASHVSKIPNLEVVATFQNPLESFEILKSQKIDLIFLDIQMPLLTGIEFLNSLSNPPKVILTTAYREYAVESYELEVIDYLLKPISFDRFFKAVNKYFKSVESTPIKTISPPEYDEESRFIYLNENKKHHKVFFSDIIYVESVKDYVKIYTSENTITTKDKISDFQHKLPDDFLRTHRSFIINTHKITACTVHDIELGQIEIPIGISYKQHVLEVLKLG